MKIKFIILLALVFSLHVTSADARIKKTAAPEIEVTISAVYENDDLIGKINYKNHSEKQVYLDRYDSGIAGIWSGYGFFVADEKGNTLMYMGPRVKAKYVGNNFVPLPPGEELNGEVNMTKDKFLKLAKGKKYTLYFVNSGYYVPGHSSATFPVESNIVEFTAQ